MFSCNGISAYLVCFLFYFICFHKEHQVDKNVSMVPIKNSVPNKIRLKIKNKRSGE